MASTEYIRAAVTAYKNGQPYTPTADVVQFAFPASGLEPPSVWYDGSWESNTEPPYYADCLVGPAGVYVTSSGNWDVFLKLQDSPEAPVRLIGVLHVE